MHFEVVTPHPPSDIVTTLHLKTSKTSKIASRVYFQRQSLLFFRRQTARGKLDRFGAELQLIANGLRNRKAVSME